MRKELTDIKDLNAEMTDKEIEFIKKLIVEQKPKKIVEIGVAAGGSSVAILKELENLDYNVKMYSIDLSETYYRDRSKKTGYMIEKFKKGRLQIKTQHELIVGNYAPVALERIGRDIDFLILDTVHSLPGEILDFLAFLPFLKIGAVVVLHDIILNHLSDNSAGYATQVLLDSVVGDKITPIDINDLFPGIGAFIVNRDTFKYINDLFCSLMITWEYLPNDEEIRIYRERFVKEYSKKQIYIFDKAVELNFRTVNHIKDCKLKCLCEYGEIVGLLHGKRVYIYGNGYYGCKVGKLLERSGVIIDNYIVTQKEKETFENVIDINEFKIINAKNYCVVIGVGDRYRDEVINTLIENNVNEYITLSNELMNLV